MTPPTATAVLAPRRIEGPARARRSGSEAVREWTLIGLAFGLPLVFNPFGTLAFEPFKLSLLRIGALVLLGSFAAQLWSGERGLPTAIWGRARPISWAVMAYLLATVLSSVTSMQPLPSLLGSYDRLQGALTLAALVTIFLAAAEHRRPERLVDALLLGSLPVCLYALLQQARLDPLPWLDRTLGPPSTVGSSTALGGYLAMLLPLTLARAAQVPARLTDLGSGRAALHQGGTWRLSGLLMLGGLQAIGVLVSAVRGALFGLIAGLAVLALLLLWRGQGRRRAGLLLMVVGVVLTGTIVLNLPGALPRELREANPYLERLGDIGDDTSGEERLLIWQAGLETWLGSGPRLLVGFGPETQAVALEARFPLELANRAPGLRVDQAHNLLVDQALTTGLLGVAALLGLLAAVGWEGVAAVRGTGAPWLAAALSGTLAAQVVESLFAFGSASTLLVWWIALGLLAGLKRPDELVGGRPGRRRPRRVLAGLTVALMVGLLPLLVSPVLADLAYTRALAYRAGENPAGELAWLRRAVDLAPDRDLYPLGLGVALVEQAELEGSARRRTELFEQAEGALRRAVRLNPADPYNHFHLGRGLERRSEAERSERLLTAAVEAYREASRLSPQRADLSDALGLALQRLGRHEEALTALRSGLELRGPEAERAAWIGDSLLALDRAAEARASYEMALERAPRSAAAHAGLARLHQREGELEQALEAGRQAARFQSRQWRYHELLAQLEEAAGNRSGALLAARAAARFAPPWERDRLRGEVARLR